MARRSQWLYLLAPVLSAAYFGLGVILPRAQERRGTAAFDIYAYFYPNAVYAWRSIRAGAGLLWNPYQDCGQPFFAISTTGLLYPVNLVFAVFEREPALLLSLMLNLTIGGVAALLLFREIGLELAAALCGAFAFQLSGSAPNLAAWSPMHIAPYVWIPAAMLFAERLLRTPTVRAGLFLGVVLTVQILPGFPQTVFFTCQLIVLRVAWGVLTRQVRQPLRLLLALGLGGVLPLFLGAVQVIPSIELASYSLRNLPLKGTELGPGLNWLYLRLTMGGWTVVPGNIMAAALAGVAFCRRATRGIATFYLLFAVLFFLLSLGPGTPVFDVYTRLPLGSAFRGPVRFLWMTSFGVSALVALGADGILRAGAEQSRATRIALFLVVVLGLALFGLISSTGLHVREAPLLVVAGTVALLAVLKPPFAWLTRTVLPLAVFLNCIWIRSPLLPEHRTGDLYGVHAAAFEFLRGLVTAQDRVYIVGEHTDFSIIPKSGSLFRVPNIHDYEPQAPRAYVEFFTWLRTGHGLRSINEWYYVGGSLMPRGFNRRLLNLAAARYLIIDHREDRTATLLPSGLRERFSDQDISIYENTQALPRAFFVPRVRVVPEAQVLPLLARGAVDPRQVALVSAPPRSWARRSGGTGTAEIVENDAERVVIHTTATAPGFLYLADQYFPGWTARVNGARAEILRANHAFRLVAVPGGRSEVVLEYRPRSLYLGAAFSLITAVLVIGYLWGGRVRRGRREKELRVAASVGPA